MTGSTAVPKPSLHALASWPAWLPVVSAGGPALIALATYVGMDVERPAVLALLLALSVAPFFVGSTRAAAPYVTAAALALQHLAAEPLGIQDPDGAAQASLLILCFAVGETAAVRSTAHTVVMAVLAAGVIVGARVIDETYDATPIWIGGVGIGLFCGLLIRRLAEAQTALAADAATRERQRIAREVHDVIAHSMTVTMLHVTAARMAVSRGDNAAATEALEEAERQGRRSLADIRATVDVLRADDTDATSAALPSAGDLGDLIDGYRNAGVAITADVDDDIAAVPAPIALAVHRIVQEALANVAKHGAGAPASVRVRVDGAVEVEVLDDGPSAAPASNGRGHGLVGMRERAESLGGTFSAGPTAAGWRVQATIPVPQP